MSNKNGNVHVINRETGSIIRYKCSADKNLCDLRLEILAHLLFIKAHRAVGLFGNDYDLSLPSIKRLKKTNFGTKYFFHVVVYLT